MSAEVHVQADRFAAFPADEYQRYIAGHPQATPYHDGAWLQAVERAYNHAGWLVSARSSGRLCGVLPLVEVRPPIGLASLVSLPFCDLAGALADSAEIKSQLVKQAQTLASEHRIKSLELREGGTPLSSVDGESARPGAQPWPGGAKVRMLCELPEDSEALFRSYKPKLRSQIRKAGKNGLTAELRTQTDALPLFYNVFAQTMRRLGSPVHSLRWFQELQAAYGDKMLVAVVFHNQTPVGAGVVLMAGRQACIPWAATLQEYNRLAPNMLLYWTLLSHVCDRGCTQFDFGRSTLGEGTYRFKKQWGAQPHQLIWRDHNADAAHVTGEKSGAAGGGGSLGASRLRPVIEHIWRRLPLSMTNWVGPKLRRYITL